MENTCRDCLAQDVCEITGASCRKMGALVDQRKQIRNGRTTMTNTAKNSVTPKTVSEKASEPKIDETTVPAQATPTEPKASVDAQTDEKTKPSLVQRLKSAAEKLKENKKALAILGASAVIAGLAIKNSRKAVSAPDESETAFEETYADTIENDETTDEA